MVLRGGKTSYVLDEETGALLASLPPASRQTTVTAVAVSEKRIRVRAGPWGLVELAKQPGAAAHVIEAASSGLAAVGGAESLMSDPAEGVVAVAMIEATLRPMPTMDGSSGAALLLRSRSLSGNRDFAQLPGRLAEQATMGVGGVSESSARRDVDLDEHRPPPPDRKQARPIADAPWARDLSGITEAPITPIFVDVSSPAAASPPPGGVDDAAMRAKVGAIVHPERSCTDLRSLTVEIFRLKAEAQGKHEPDVAGALKMRICMLQSQWVGMASAAGIPQPTGRLDPFAAKPEDVARALMWSEAGGAIPSSELAADGGKAHQRSIREAVTLRLRGFDALLELHRGQPEEQKVLLHRELQGLGDTTPNAPGDTVDSLSQRRQENVSRRKSEEVRQDLAAADAGRKQLYMGLDGFVGTADSVQRYERNEALKASVSDTTLGSILATYLGGGDVEKMRALGQVGSNVEGIAGGAGGVVDSKRKAEEQPQGTPVLNPKRGSSLKNKGEKPATASPPAPGRAPTVGTTAGAATVARMNAGSSTAAGTGSVARVEPFNRPGAPLRTTGLLPRYAGEDIPGNKVWRNQTVTYCRTSAERARFKLEVRDVEVGGKREARIFDSQGRPFDTRTAATWDGSGKAMFVMDANGELYASTYQAAGVFHHSSLAGGQPVAAAGELTVVNGKLVAISNRSGHYLPGERFTEQALASLRARGIDLSGVAVSEESTKTTRFLP